MGLIVENLDILMFVTLAAGLLCGYPVTFTLAGVAVIFTGIGAALGAFDTALLGALAQRLFGIMTNEVLIAIPLFVFMGIVLERSQLAEELLEEMGRLFGTMRGGLAVSVVVVGALLAASTGIVGATVITMALIALPAMLRNGYSKRLAAGTVCTAGTLGQIIPPSTLLIILSEVMSSAYQQAQFEQGKFSVETISVGQTFAAALLPGLLLVGLYIAYILALALVSPKWAPAMPRQAGLAIDYRRLFEVLLPPVFLIIAVLGSIVGGVATPTEAASVGAVGAILLAAWRRDKTSRTASLVALAALAGIVVLASSTSIRLQRSDAGVGMYLLAAAGAGLVGVTGWGIWRAIHHARREGYLADVNTRTMTVSSMIFGTIIGASVFSLVFRGLGGDKRIEHLVESMPGGADGALLFVMVVIFLLGFILDFVEISVILLPIVTPALIIMGHDPIWLAVLIAINLQTSFLTPPFGFSLFYLRGAAPPDVTTGDIYSGVIPFIALQAVGVAIVWFLPQIATWLPKVMFSS
jgi:tripartite ATP-independent transporter DctM subunit